MSTMVVAQDAGVTSQTPTSEVKIGAVYMVNRPSLQSRPATVLELRRGKNAVQEAYVSYVGEDKRLDTWIPQSQLGEAVSSPTEASLLKASKPSMTSLVRVEAGPSRASTPEREHATMTRVRNFEDVRIGEYLIKTWYYSPYPKAIQVDERAGSPSAQGQKRRKLNTAERADHEVVVPKRERLWVCDLCFKYMRTRGGWERHISSCNMMQPPGRRVYQKGSYTMWEVDGAQAPLYCQNLSLFGKLFIDHKSVFFYVENFLFYVLCDAATSRRDQVMAFFSKEKVSYDDFNLACIITFPPFQNRGFGKLLIEFSYYLTHHPSTRPASLSPGTPERPLSDLGLKGYTAYWISVILRFCRSALLDAPPLPPPHPISPSKSPRARRTAESQRIRLKGIEVSRTPLPQRGQYSISIKLSDLAKACHLRLDDVVTTLLQLGFLRYRRRPVAPMGRLRHAAAEPAADEWAGVEVVISRDAVEREWSRWKVRPEGVLDESCVLL